MTGGASGMGRATALAFAAAGASVVVADVADEGGRETVAQAVQSGGTVRYVHADVSDPGQVASAVDEAVRAFGGLHCAANCAAIELETAPLAECDEATFDRIVAVNLKSVFLCMKSEITAMLASGGGAIVNVASTNSFRPQPNQPAYTASKHGVLGLTRSAAIEYGSRGIRVNAVCPGAIDTPMLRNAMAARDRDPDEVARRLTLPGRFGSPSEIAEAILWLCSDRASFTMGHALAVDGGYLAR